MSDAEDTAQKQRGRPFQPGRSGNPAGRPKGARSKLQEQFLRELCEDFEAHGTEAIVRVREEQPAQYLKVIATIIPKEVEVKHSSLEDLSDEQLIAGIAALERFIERGEVEAGAIPPTSADQPDPLH